MAERGFLQLYTGNGKGKTTAALGLALRAAGAGKQVLLAQFLKTPHCSEHRALERFADRIRVECFGNGEFVKGKVKPDQADRAREGLDIVARILKTERFGVVILDEVITAVSLGLIDVGSMLAFIRNRPPESELVLTGRGAPRELVEAADLVTEMKEVKHYFQQGVAARRGIES